MKWLNRSIVILLVISIPITLYVIFSPRHIVREFIVISRESGEYYTMSLDITVQRRLTVVRTRSISYTVAGSVTIGDMKFIRAFDDHMGREYRPVRRWWYFFTFLQYGTDLSDIDLSVMQCFDSIACCSTYFASVRPGSIRFNHVDVIVYLGHCGYLGGRTFHTITQ